MAEENESVTTVSGGPPLFIDASKWPEPAVRYFTRDYHRPASNPATREAAGT